MIVREGRDYGGFDDWPGDETVVNRLAFQHDGREVTTYPAFRRAFGLPPMA